MMWMFEGRVSLVADGEAKGIVLQLHFDCHENATDLSGTEKNGKNARAE